MEAQKIIYRAVVIFLSLISFQAFSIDTATHALEQSLGFSLSPGLVGKTLSSSPAVFSPKRVLSSIDDSPLSGASLSPEAYKITFVLNKVSISGNHVFTAEELAAIFKPFLHRKISLAQLKKLVELVSEKYQKEGYFLSKAFLPPQQIKNGHVQVTVVEGFISEVKLQGLTNPKLIAFLKKYNENIVFHKPLKLKDLERYLLIINDIPGFEVKSVLAPDPKVPLGSSLTLITEYVPFQATLTRDNYQTRFLGPLESTFFSSLNSVIMPGGTFYARALSADHFRQLNYFDFRNSHTIGTDGLVFSLDGYLTQTNPQFILKPLEILGFSGDANANLLYPLIRTRSKNLSLQAQFDYMNNSSNALQQLLYSDKIRDVTLSAQYSDNLAKGDDTISFVIDKGLNIFNANNNQVHSRFGVTPNFLKLILTASRTQYLNERFSLSALVTTQYANVPLYAAETMIFGGPFIGRGYDWGQFIGDQGVAGKAEFMINTAPNFPFLKQVQYYAFLDAGKLFSRIPNVSPVSGTSGGFGLRAMLMKHLNAEGFIGKPLTTPNATQIILGESGYRFQAYFQVTAYI